MLSKFSALGRLRHFGVEAACAVVLTLCAATVAYAARPQIADAPMQTAPKAPAARPAPPPPPPVFDCGNPVPGHAVNSPFGLRRMPWERAGRLHEGVDIAAPIGVKVVAVADGIVVQAGNSPSYGRYVEIQHGAGLTTFYAHLGRIAVEAKPGAFIEAGDAVGKIGSSGTSTGPHVHFEIRQAERPLNPVVFMNREFATAEDLPVKQAAYVSRRVRVAQVSQVPQSKRALMGQTAEQTAEGRVRATLNFDS